MKSSGGLYFWVWVNWVTPVNVERGRKRQCEVSGLPGPGEAAAACRADQHRGFRYTYDRHSNIYTPSQARQLTLKLELQPPVTTLKLLCPAANVCTVLYTSLYDNHKQPNKYIPPKINKLYCLMIINVSKIITIF